MEISQVSPSSIASAPAPAADPAALRATAPAPAPTAPAATDSVELSDAAKASGTGAKDAAAAPPSAVNSLVHGALGLQSPEEEKSQSNGFYTAGRYLAAAATAGAFLSLIL
jgi:hypothetical protein